MASAKRLDSGSYRTLACKTINGKKVRKSFTVSPDDYPKDDAKTAAKKAKAQSELLAREWMFAKDEEEKKADIFTVSKAIDRYNEVKEGVTSPSTFADYLRMKKYFAPILDVDIHDVTTDMIQGIISNMAVQKNRYGKPLSEGTIKNRIFYFLGMLNYFEINKKFKLTFPAPGDKKDLLPPEENEYERLISYAECEEDKLIIMLCGLYTLRRGEACALRGEDILWDMHSIRVSHSRVLNKDKVLVMKPPKTAKSVRTIEIAPEYMCLFPHVGPKEFLIKKTPNQCTKMFIKLRKKACVDCRLHDLRKYAASIRSDMNMPKKYVEADGGWKPGSPVLAKIYDKPFRKERQRYSKQFNENVVEKYSNKFLANE